MSNNSRGDDRWTILVIGGVVAIVAYIIWRFSTFFGLDMNSGTAVFGRLVTLVVLVGASWKFGDDFELISLENTWPVLLALLWSCWWPALEFWASNPSLPFKSEEVPTIWWNAWYTEWAVFVAIIALGYLVIKMLND